MSSESAVPQSGDQVNGCGDSALIIKAHECMEDVVHHDVDMPYFSCCRRPSMTGPTRTSHACATIDDSGLVAALFLDAAQLRDAKPEPCC